MSSPLQIWTSSVELEEKALTQDETNHVLSGYAATFHDVDRVQDAIMPGAFKKCLERMDKRGESLQLYLNHDLKIPIGAIVQIGEDKKGLRYTAHLPVSDSLVSGRIIPQIKARALKQNSIGYKVRRSERRKSDGVRLLHEIDVHEISVVGMPANPAAMIEHCKGLVEFQDLPFDKRAPACDPADALKRVKDYFGDSEEIRTAFLYVDEEKSVDEWDTRFLIADVNEDGTGLYANQNLIYKATVAAMGARKGGLALPEEAEEAIRSNLERYYDRLNLKSPFSSISIPEWKALSSDEREVRLKGLGVTGDLAKALATMQLKGPREADRTSGEREVRLADDAKGLINTEVAKALSLGLADLVKAIRNP